MNHRDKLIQIHRLVSKNTKHLNQSIAKNQKIPQEILDKINLIATNCFKQKGVYTVLITLLIHKSLNPQQDIRFHQENLSKGFSGRTIDTKYITPTLKSLGLPSMSESGWLTRSLEQPFPYLMDYQGKISGKGVKDAFLSILDFLEVKTEPINQQKLAEILATYLLKRVREISIFDFIFGKY